MPVEVHDLKGPRDTQFLKDRFARRDEHVPVGALRQKRCKVPALVNVIENQEPAIGSVKPLQHCSNDVLLIARGRGGQAERLGNLDEAARQSAYRLGVDPKDTVRIVGAMPRAILDRGLRLADSAEAAERRAVMLQELLTKQREKILTAGEIASAHRIGDKPGSLEGAPPAALRTQRAECPGLGPRLA